MSATNRDEGWIFPVSMTVKAVPGTDLLVGRKDDKLLLMRLKGTAVMEGFEIPEAQWDAWCQTTSALLWPEEMILHTSLRREDKLRPSDTLRDLLLERLKDLLSLNCFKIKEGDYEVVVRRHRFPKEPLR